MLSKTSSLSSKSTSERLQSSDVSKSDSFILALLELVSRLEADKLSVLLITLGLFATFWLGADLSETLHRSEREFIALRIKVQVFCNLPLTEFFVDIFLDQRKLHLI